MQIYLITNKANNKQYVGKTTGSLERRFRKHLSLARTGEGWKLHQAIRKYGEENFSISLLEECNTEDQYHKIEELYILDLDTYRNGYNSSKGGKGERRSKESYEIQSEKMKGREITWGDKISKALKASDYVHPMKGKQYSDTSSFKGNTQAGKWNKLLKGKNVRCMEDNVVFESIREAGKYYSVSDSTIKRAMDSRNGLVKKINKTFVTI